MSGFTAYLRSAALLAKLTSAFRSLHAAVWLGLLSPSSYVPLTAEYYRRASRYRDDNYNLSGLHPWESAFVDAQFPPQSSVLIAAAGGGREALALAARQFRVTAFDCQPDLVRAAQALATRQNLDLTILHCLPDQLPPAPTPFQAAILGWGGYSHIAGKQSRIAVLERLRRHTVPNAPLLVSFLVRTGGESSFPLIHTVANALRFILRRQPVELGDLLDGSFDHYFTLAEFRAEAESAGWSVTRLAASPYGHAELSNSSPP